MAEILFHENMNNYRNNSHAELIDNIKDFFTNLTKESLPAKQYSYLRDGLVTLQYLGKFQLTDEIKLKFIKYSLEAFQHVFTVFSHHQLLNDVLNQAITFASHVGDSRSEAIIHLQLSASLLILNNLEESNKAYQRGLTLVDSLGDTEISANAARFSITYHMLRGEPRIVLDIYEQVRSSLQTEYEIDPFVLTHILPCAALSAAFTGNFQLGIRILQNGRHSAKLHGYPVAEQCLQAQLGWLLVASKDLTQARKNITAGIDVPDERTVPISRFWMERNLAYLYYAEGDHQKAYDQMKQATIRAEEQGMTTMLYVTPWFIEMLRSFRQEGFLPFPGLEYEEELYRVFNGINLHLKGVAHRLHAADAKLKNTPWQEQLDSLQLSEQHLLSVSGQVELVKTWVEIARLYIENGEVNRAQSYIDKAWHLNSQLSLHIFPDDLYQYVDQTRTMPKVEPFWPRYKSLMRLLNQIPVPSTQKELYKNLVAVVCNFFGAEVGAFFVIDGNSDAIQLETGFNYLEHTNKTRHGKWIHSLILKTAEEGRSVIQEVAAEGERNKSALFIPIPTISGSAVLYLGTSYRMDVFQEESEERLARLADNVGLQLSNLINWHTKIEDNYRQNLGQLSAAKEISDSKILFTSTVMRKVLTEVEQAARSDAPILISGETGVGKELLAFYIHERSPRRKMPFVTVDLNTTPENLIESELFGHEKGAFTGAETKKTGSFELADKGSFFIDEIGEIPLAIQTKLLRVLQEKTFKHVGGIRTYQSDFRLIVATNRDLQMEVKNRRFREDLFHRLNVIPIILPPLRERKEDILLLAYHFLSQFSKKHSKPGFKLSKYLEQTLVAYSWPGNIRELKNLMERVVVLEDSSLIAPLRPEIDQAPARVSPANEESELIPLKNKRLLTLDKGVEK